MDFLGGRAIRDAGHRVDHVSHVNYWDLRIAATVY